MKRSLILAAAAVMANGCSHEMVQTASAPGVIFVQPEHAGMMPMGTEMVVRVNSALGGAGSRSGDVFNATVLSDLLAKDNSVAVPAGAGLWGHVSEIRQAPSPAQSIIRVAFDSLNFNNTMHLFSGTVKSVAIPDQSCGTVVVLGNGSTVGTTIPAGSMITVTASKNIQLR